MRVYKSNQGFLTDISTGLQNAIPGGKSICASLTPLQPICPFNLFIMLGGVALILGGLAK